MQPSRLVVVIAFAAVYLIWGSTYFAILLAIRSIPPFLMAGSRYLIAGVILYAASRVTGAKRAALITWRSAAIIGTCLLLGGNGGVTVSEQFVPTGLAAVIVATVPIFMVLFSWLSGSAPRPTLPVFLGLAGGFVGVGILMAPALNFSGNENHRTLIGILILLCGSFIWSAGSIYSRHARNPESAFLGAGQQMICGGVALLLAALVTRERIDLHAVTAQSVWAWIYLVFIGAIIGFTAYIFLLRHCEPAKVATYAYVNPIVAIFLGIAFAGEHLNWPIGVGAAVIIGSVAIVIATQQMKAQRTEPTAVANPDCV